MNKLVEPLTEDEKWLLSTIKIMGEAVKESNARGIQDRATWPRHGNIWRGCYDVHYCEQDAIDAWEIPRARMKAAEEAGLITTEGPLTDEQKAFVVKWAKYDRTRIWSLTELGEQRLEITP